MGMGMMAAANVVKNFYVCFERQLFDISVEQVTQAKRLIAEGRGEELVGPIKRWGEEVAAKQQAAIRTARWDASFNGHFSDL